MYIDDSGHMYYRYGSQHHSRAPFLILVQPEGLDGASKPIRALVRKVALRQCGHFMMGFARAFNHDIRISGAYGSDGLPRSVPQEVYDKATPVPEHLIKMWNEGEGWNSAGTEAPAMRDWAQKTFLK